MSAAENKAVFLSYASQDAEAARRICEALRAAGIEVWFDQSELVGGDAWDAKIRGQINSTEQCSKACLREMVIAGEGLGEPVFLHHDKRNAICQRPVLIGAGRVKFDPAIKQTGIRWNDRDGGIVAQFSVKLRKSGPQCAGRKGRRDFTHNPSRSDNLHVLPAVILDRTFVIAVARVERREKEIRVGEYPHLPRRRAVEVMIVIFRQVSGKFRQSAGELTESRRPLLARFSARCDQRFDPHFCALRQVYAGWQHNGAVGDFPEESHAEHAKYSSPENKTTSCGQWKLAAQRTHAMAEAKAFLLPVVIDDTRDAEQIKVGALLRPIISGNTQARAENHFPNEGNPKR